MVSNGVLPQRLGAALVPATGGAGLREALEVLHPEALPPASARPGPDAVRVEEAVYALQRLLGWSPQVPRGPASAAEERVSLSSASGHEIRKRDFGRPVHLIAGGLGAMPEQFRRAFSGVTPAKGRGPTREEERKNKAAMMKVLAPLGVTNERLDEVADDYRFRPQEGELWPTKPAKGYAVVEGAKVKQLVVTRAWIVFSRN